MEKIVKNKRKGESGNVLFLILIAVALFAALSYAVTQSTRSGGGDATSETNLVNSAQLTQYPAGIRTAMVRMIISGVVATDIEFNPPSDFTNCTDTDGVVGAPFEYGRCVFHPDGGGATYQLAPDSVMDTGTGEWFYNMEFEIDNIGTSDAGSSDGNDLIAFLPGVTLGLCQKINDELGMGTTIDNNAADWTTEIETYMDDGYALPAGETVIGTGSTANLSGQPFGCFQNNGANYVYYHVLIER